jgi:hypothetical protein
MTKAASAAFVCHRSAEIAVAEIEIHVGLLVEFDLGGVVGVLLMVVRVVAGLADVIDAGFRGEIAAG